MKVELVKLIFDENRSYKYKPMSFCCDKLKDNPIIELIDAYQYEDDTSDDIPKMCLDYHYEWSDWGEDMEDDRYYPLKFCPFCGEKIDIEVVGEEDHTERYKKLESERKDFWSEVMATDSKSQEECLRRKVKELDRKIDYYYDLREYIEE